MDYTVQREMATREKRSATKLELNTYALLQSFSHARNKIPVMILCLPSHFCTSYGCAANRRPFQTCALRLVLCDGSRAATTSMLHESVSPRWKCSCLYLCVYSECS